MLPNLVKCVLVIRKLVKGVLVIPNLVKCVFVVRNLVKSVFVKWKTESCEMSLSYEIL